MANDSKISFQIGVSVNGTPAVTAFSNEIKKLDDTAKKTSQSFSTFGDTVKALAFSRIASHVMEFGKSIFELADQLEAAAIATGINAEQLQKLRIVAEQNNITFESLQGGLKKLAKGYYDAQSGSKEFINLFKQLGVSLKETDLNKVLEQTAKGFARLQDGTGKQALASKAFGRALSADAIPFLHDLKNGLQDVAAVMTNDTVDRINDITDRFKLLRAQAQSIGASFISLLLPSISKILDYVKLLTDTGENSKFSEFIQAIVDIGIEVIAVFDRIITGIGQIVDSVKIAGLQLSKLGNLAAFDFDGAAKKTKEQNDLYVGMMKSSEKLDARLKELFKGSFLRSNIEDYKEWKKLIDADTKPTEKLKGGRQEVEAIDERDKSRKDEAEKYARERIEKIQLETNALFQSNAETRLANELKQLEFHGLKANTQQYKDYAEQIRNALELQEEQRNSARAGAFKFFEDYGEAATNAAKITQEAFSSAFKGVEDVMVDFITNGKKTFADFARAIIADLARILVRASITGPIANAISSALGGSGDFSSAFGVSAGANGMVMTSSGKMPLESYATGGIATKPQLALFGEGRMNEAFVPLPDGKRIPVNLQNSGNTRGDTNVSVTVNAQTGDTNVSGGDDRLNRLGKTISEVVQQEIIRQRRSGGLLNG